MACPYFYPEDRLPESAWPRHPRLPLGDPFGGMCHADSAHPVAPAQESLRSFCNLGYGRGRCPNFPAAKGPDAYRFSIIGEDEGTVKLFFIAEQEHYPLESGTLEALSVDDPSVSSGPETFRRQACAYIESYVRRQREPESQASNPNRR